MAQIYHGCMTINSNGSKIIIGPDVKNALFQLTNVFGKILRTLRAVGLKHVALQKRNQL